MKTIARRSAMFAYHRFYRAIHDPACIYCGLRATTKDHFVPISVVAMLAAANAPVTGKFLLPCCGECNSIASNSVFRTVAAKRRYIHDRLRRKYAAVLGMPEWSERERDELGWTLRSHIEAGMAQKSVLEQRLAWRNTSVSCHVDIAKIRFGLLARGQSFARENAG